MTIDRFVDLVERAQDGDGYPRAHRGYSGRGMCGEACVGFDSRSPVADTAAILAQVESLDELRELAKLFDSSRQDTMGRGWIVYFPRLKDNAPPTSSGDDE